MKKDFNPGARIPVINSTSVGGLLVGDFCNVFTKLMNLFMFNLTSTGYRYKLTYSYNFSFTYSA